MQAMKERVVEHVRYRTVGDFRHDLDSQSVLHVMRGKAYRYLLECGQHSDAARRPVPPLGGAAQRSRQRGHARLAQLGGE